MSYSKWAIALLMTSTLWGAVRVNLRLGAGHPIRRANRTVVVRRPAVVARTPVVYARPVVWTRTVVAVPPRDRLVWQDSETIQKDEDWIDTNLKVNARGTALYLGIQGRAQLDFAEVTFRNGQVQVVDLHEDTLQAGTYRLIDFPGVRQVESVRLVARARSDSAGVSVLMAK